MKDNNGNNKSSMVILTIIGIATLLVAVIGATFAYFTVNIKGNPTEKNMEVQSVQLGEIVFNNPNKIIYENAIPGRPDHNDLTNPVNNRINFTIKNDPKSTVSQKYKIMLNVSSNTYETDNVVYTLTANPSPEFGKAVKPVGTEFENITPVNSILGTQYYSTTNCIDEGSNCVDHTFEDGSTAKLGFIKAGFIGINDPDTNEKNAIKIGTGNLGNFGAIDSWEFEIWINETKENQANDQGKRIEAYITIDLDEADVHSNEKGIINQ